MLEMIQFVGTVRPCLKAQVFIAAWDETPAEEGDAQNVKMGIKAHTFSQ